MMKTLLLIAALLSLVTTASADQTNLLINPGFEQLDEVHTGFPSQWTVSTEKGLIDAPQHYEGQRAGMIVGDGTAQAWAQYVEPPEQTGIQLSGMVKAENVVMNEGDYAYLYIHVLYKDQPYSQTTHLYTRLEPDSYDWSRVIVRGKGQENLEVSHLQVSVSGKFTSGRIYVDDLKLTTDDSLSPNELLRNKINDLNTSLARVGDDDASAEAARSELSRAVALLDIDPPDLEAAHDHWVRGAGEVSHTAWATMYPEAINGPPLAAQMIYHGLGETKADCDAYLDRVEAIGANAMYLSLGSWMYVVYESDVLPVHKSHQLEYLIEQAHLRGIKVFAYVAVFYGTHDVMVLPGSIAEQHPDWLATSGPVPNMPTFPDPANPEVVEHMAEAFVELATRYDLDGIGLDYIRYPGDTSLNYDQRNRDAILSGYGIDIFAEDKLYHQPEKWAKIRAYRRGVIANAVETIRDAVHEASPDTAIMACLISEPRMASDSVAQAWMDWGPWVDYASPMNYDDRPLNSNMLEEQKQGFAKTRSRWIPAVGGMPYTTHDKWTISDWAQRVAATRQHDPDGIILYRIAEFDMGVAAFFRNGPFHGDPEFPAPLEK